METTTEATGSLLSAPAAMVGLWGHPRLAQQNNRHCPEDAAAWRKKCAEGANQFLKQVRTQVSKYRSRQMCWAHLMYGTSTRIFISPGVPTDNASFSIVGRVPLARH